MAPESVGSAAELAGRVPKPAGRPSEPAGKPQGGDRWTDKRTDGRTDRGPQSQLGGPGPPSKLGEPLRRLQRWEVLGSCWVSLGASWKGLMANWEAPGGTDKQTEGQMNGRTNKQADEWTTTAQKEK